MNAMAVTYSKAGRPCFVAVLDFRNDRHLAFRDQFHKACSDFKYRDIVAVSRACGVCRGTVENWKYGLSFPHKDIAQQIIDWVAAGKPMKLVRPFPETFNMI